MKGHSVSTVEVLSVSAGSSFRQSASPPGLPDAGDVQHLRGGGTGERQVGCFGFSQAPGQAKTSGGTQVTFSAQWYGFARIHRAGAVPQQVRGLGPREPARCHRQGRFRAVGLSPCATDRLHTRGGGTDACSGMLRYLLREAVVLVVDKKQDRRGHLHGPLPPDVKEPEFRRGREDGFDAWWHHGDYAPKSQDLDYLRGYAFGWEMASDPLHEDSFDPHLDPRLKAKARSRR